MGMPTGQDLIVVIITLGAMLMLVRNIMLGRRSACGRGGACGCDPTKKPLEDRMGRRRELVQLQIGTPGPSDTETTAQSKS